jgi:hypothetical protein
MLPADTDEVNRINSALAIVSKINPNFFALSETKGVQIPVTTVVITPAGELKSVKKIK